MERTRNSPKKITAGAIKKLGERLCDMNLEGQRKDIRAFHKELRAEMSEAEVQKKSGRICEQLLQADWYADCRIIYGYYPLNNEVDCLPFLRQALADGKAVALPRVGSNKGHMEFYRINDFSQVAEGSFHVMEPMDSCPVVQEQEAIVLVPGVAFDRQGNRYGYGGGYYDRYFARFPGLRRMALAYENQMEALIPVLDTDVGMDAVYTERSIYS